MQKDNVRPHEARVVQNFLNICNIQIMNWSPRSPDLNAIEHVWDTHGQQLKERQPLRNLQHVEEILLEEWEDMALQGIRNLIENIPRRCAELLCVKGDHTHY
jgi:hypothetical protein